MLKFALIATLLFTCSLSLTNAWAATLTATPANIAQGGTVTATWSAVSAPTTREWIALAAPGAVDTTYIDWIYVNTCSKSGGSTAPASGQCPFLIPSSLPNGSYELRLFAANGYTRLATSNQLNVSPLPPPRFIGNADGTVTDIQTGLMWIGKSGIRSTPIFCSNLTDCPNPHDVNNIYGWSSSGVAADGPLFTNFLARINGNLCDSSNCPRGFAGYSDWRIPTRAELSTISAFPGNDCDNRSFSPPCIVAPLNNYSLGIPMPRTFWSSTTYTVAPSLAFVFNFAYDPGVPETVCGQPPLGMALFIECHSKGAANAVFAVRGGPQER